MPNNLRFGHQLFSIIRQYKHRNPIIGYKAKPQCIKLGLNLEKPHQERFINKGGSVVETITLTIQHNFFFFYLFKNCPQFFSHWELSEPVFCSEELNCRPYKNQNKSLTLSSLAGKFKFAVWSEFICIKEFLPPRPNVTREVIRCENFVVTIPI